MHWIESRNYHKRLIKYPESSTLIISDSKEKGLVGTWMFGTVALVNIPLTVVSEKTKLKM